MKKQNYVEVMRFNDKSITNVFLSLKIRSSIVLKYCFCISSNLFTSKSV